MMNLNYQMIHIKCQIFKIVTSKSKKRHDELSTNPSIHIYINRINNISVFQIKDRRLKP